MNESELNEQWNDIEEAQLQLLLEEEEQRNEKAADEAYRRNWIWNHETGDYTDEDGCVRDIGGDRL